LPLLKFQPSHQILWRFSQWSMGQCAGEEE